MRSASWPQLVPQRRPYASPQTDEEFTPGQEALRRVLGPRRPCASDQRRRGSQAGHRSALTSARSRWPRSRSDLQNIAATLAEAQRSGHVSIGDLKPGSCRSTTLIDIGDAGRRGRRPAAGLVGAQGRASTPPRQSLGEMTALRDAYGAKLDAARWTWPPTATTPVRSAARCRMPLRHNQMEGPASRAVLMMRSTRSPARLYPRGTEVPRRWIRRHVEDFKAMARPELLRQGVPPNRSRRN